MVRLTVGLGEEDHRGEVPLADMGLGVGAGLDLTWLTW